MKLNKYLMIGAAVCSLSACHANGNVEVKFDTANHPDTLFVSYSLMSDLAKARRAADIPSVEDTLVMLGNKGNIALSADSAAQYQISFPDGKLITFYAEPGDNLTVNVTKINPVFEYTVTGSPLMDGITQLDSKLNPIEDAYRKLMEVGDVAPEKRDALIDQYNKIAADFVRGNADSPAAAYALMSYDGDEYLELFELLTPKAKSSMFYPLASKKADSVKESLEKERLQKEMMNGSVTAPDFRLKNLDGKEVSLSDFRGKYVIIDFWGSWCVWCIRGIPHLKEAYNQYKDRLEVIGVDCRDSDDAWRKAVAKYELPWVNLYNPDNSSVLADYGVQGFPTKVIVNPEGKIVNITTGEDPAFYTALEKFMAR